MGSPLFAKLSFRSKKGLQKYTKLSVFGPEDVHKCSHFSELKRIGRDWIELRRIEITGVFCQSAIDCMVVFEFLIRRSQVRSLPGVPKKSYDAAKLTACNMAVFLGMVIVANLCPG